MLVHVLEILYLGTAALLVCIFAYQSWGRG